MGVPPLLPPLTGSWKSDVTVFEGRRAPTCKRHQLQSGWMTREAELQRQDAPLADAGTHTTRVKLPDGRGADHTGAHSVTRDDVSRRYVRQEEVGRRSGCGAGQGWREEGYWCATEPLSVDFNFLEKNTHVKVDRDCGGFGRRTLASRPVGLANGEVISLITTVASRVPTLEPKFGINDQRVPPRCRFKESCVAWVSSVAFHRAFPSDLVVKGPHCRRSCLVVTEAAFLELDSRTLLKNWPLQNRQQGFPVRSSHVKLCVPGDGNTFKRHQAPQIGAKPCFASGPVQHFK